jgi:alkyl sulfatase BDS1-like metallo-beta-lactamase superfamily hydrolase
VSSRIEENSFLLHQTKKEKNMKKLIMTMVACLIFAAPAVFAEDTVETKKLKARDVELREDIIKVAEGVYTSVGHTVSTVSMIVGTDGIIIVDTGMSPIHMKPVMQAFRKITDKPVKAIILTHSHGDHTRGIKVFKGDDNPEIWGRSNFGSETTGLSGLNTMFRGVRQAGFRLPPDKRINNGVAPAMTPMTGRVHKAPKASSPPKPGVRRPQPAGGFNLRALPKLTKTFSGERETLEIAGIRMDLVAAPGETHDQLYVWLPEKKVVFSGDNFYASFPNLYAIRGVPYRDVRNWADSVDKMLKEGPEYLVPGHTRPILGKEAVTQALTDYRDAIRYVYDKTIEGINKQMTPEELVEYVKLPPHLAEKDYLGEYYGLVSWAVRSIYAGHLGPFDGNATNLFPLSPKEEAKRLAKIAGGRDVLLKQAQEALDTGDYQWAAQLADHLIVLDKQAVEPLKIKADAMNALGERQMNAPARNYYFTYEMELRQQVARTGGGQSGAKSSPFMQNFDRDKDGKVSKDEFPGPDFVFGNLDKNGDGYLDAKETPTGPPGGGGN